jgi:hypothetical protein
MIRHRSDCVDEQIQKHRCHGKFLLRKVCVCQGNGNSRMTGSRRESQRSAIFRFWPPEPMANRQPDKHKGSERDKGATANQRQNMRRCRRQDDQTAPQQPHTSEL